jgi:hypothetical protein
MKQNIHIYEKHFPTFGNEVCVSIDVVLGERVHTLILNHSNVDGDSEDMLTVEFSTPEGFKSALEEAEDRDFELDYDLKQMATNGKRLPKEFFAVFAEMQAERDLWDKPITSLGGGFKHTRLSPKEARRLYGSSLIIVGGQRTASDD